MVMGMLWDYWYAPVATQEGVGEVRQVLLLLTFSQTQRLICQMVEHNTIQQICTVEL